MHDLPVFQKKQFEFSAYIRDPQQYPAPPDIEPRRMAVYRELFFNNVESFLANTFPVLKSVMQEDNWITLVQDYFCTNRSESPYFTSIPEHFIDYVNSDNVIDLDNFPFARELAHYEWIEMVLELAEGEVSSVTRLQNESLLLSVARISDLAYPLVYQFPVHKISPEYKPQTPPGNPTYLVVYRTPDDKVNFMEINAVTYALIDSISNHPEYACQVHLQCIIEQINHPQPKQAFDYGISILQGLFDRNILEVVNSGNF